MTKGTVVSPHIFYSWKPQEREIKQKCYCGKFACIGYPAEYGNLELLCFKHYKERINNGTNKETKEITNGSTKSNFEKTKEK